MVPAPASLARMSPGQRGVSHSGADTQELLRPHLRGTCLGRHPPGGSSYTGKVPDKVPDLDIFTSCDLN